MFSGIGVADPRRDVHHRRCLFDAKMGAGEFTRHLPPKWLKITEIPAIPAPHRASVSFPSTGSFVASNAADLA